MQGVNFFELLGLVPAYILEMDKLEARYQEILRKVHPDKWGPGLAKQSAHALSVQINKAYITLKDPLTRAQHILELYHLWPYMPLNEQMEAFFSLQEQGLSQNMWEKEYTQALAHMECAFKEGDLEKARSYLWWAMMSRHSVSDDS